MSGIVLCSDFGPPCSTFVHTRFCSVCLIASWFGQISPLGICRGWMHAHSSSLAYGPYPYSAHELEGEGAVRRARCDVKRESTGVKSARVTPIRLPRAFYTRSCQRKTQLFSHFGWSSFVRSFSPHGERTTARFVAEIVAVYVGLAMRPRSVTPKNAPLWWKPTVIHLLIEFLSQVCGGTKSTLPRP